MSASDIEKQPGAAPASTGPGRTSSFLPTYKDHLNRNLRTFGQPNGQVDVTTSELVDVPKKHGRRQCMKREYFITAFILFFICAIALPLGLVFIIRDNHAENDLSTLQTRQAQSSFSPLAVTAPTQTLTIVPVTEIITVTPTPGPSTPTITITVTHVPEVKASSTTSTSDSTVTVTALTSIHPSLPASSDRTTLSQSTLNPLVRPMSTLSKFSIDPALEPSILSVLEQASASAAKDATTAHETTTVVSAKTIEPPTSVHKVMQTATGRFGFCGVAGSSC